MKSRNKRVRKLKGSLLNVARSMGKWKAQDDLLLILSVLHLTNIKDVYNLTKFSGKFTLKELEERWHAVLYDAPISRMIYKNIKKIHSDDLIRIKRLVPFNQTEDFILLNLESNIDASNNFFEKLLVDNRIYFNEARTSECLKKQYKLFKKLNLLKDQIKNAKNDKEEVDVPVVIDVDEENNEGNEGPIRDGDLKEANKLDVQFRQIENSLDDENIFNQIELNDQIKIEMKESYDNLLHQIKRAEADTFLWQALVDKVTGAKNPFTDETTYAVLFSEHFTYSIKSNEITIGRSTNTQSVDIDLSNFQENKKISRQQCSISMQEPGVFYLYNHGKLAVYVDGKVLMTLTRTQIYDKSIIEIGDISILFLLNYNTMGPPVVSTSQGASNLNEILKASN